MMFLQDKTHFDILRPLFKTMVDLRNINDPKVQLVVDDAIQHPENYVLKP
jgi:hypothetical protein